MNRIIIQTGTIMYHYIILLPLILLIYGFVTVPGSSSDGFDARNVRDYYIQAEKIDWNYLPYRQNLVDNYNE